MQRFFVAAASAAMLFASGGTAAVAGPSGGNTVMVGVGPQGHRILITFRFANEAASYAFTANDRLNTLPKADQESVPIPGVALMIEKVPGPPSASRAIIPGARGLRSLGSRVAPGAYDVVILLPLNAAATKATRGRAASPNTGNVTLTFHIVVDAKGDMAMDPRQPPTVTGTAPREPTQ